MPKAKTAEQQTIVSKQDVINKLDEVHFVLNEHKTNSTGEPIDYRPLMDSLQSVLDHVKEITKAKE